jgi:hypothetical protein
MKEQSKAQKLGHKIRIQKLREANPDFFPEIGSIGGHLSTTKYTSETGRINANKRWEKYRLDQAKKRKENE